ncbi:unnamed protein product [Pylaiella littoralis]
MGIISSPCFLFPAIVQQYILGGEICVLPTATYIAVTATYIAVHKRAAVTAAAAELRYKYLWYRSILHSPDRVSMVFNLSDIGSSTERKNFVEVQQVVYCCCTCLCHRHCHRCCYRIYVLLPDTCTRNHTKLNCCCRRSPTAAVRSEPIFEARLLSLYAQKYCCWVVTKKNGNLNGRTHE